MTISTYLLISSDLPQGMFVNSHANVSLCFSEKDNHKSFGPAALFLLNKPTTLMVSVVNGALVSSWIVSLESACWWSIVALG